jgi:hypothetical protein
MSNNLLAYANIGLWTSAGVPPANFWNGSAYVFANLSTTFTLSGYTTQAGDVIGVNAIVAATGKLGTIQVSVNGTPIENTAGNTVFDCTSTTGQQAEWIIPPGTSTMTINFNATGDSGTTFTVTPFLPIIPVSPNLNVKVPNESQGTTITPQILYNGIPSPGATLAIVTQPTQGTVAVVGSAFVYTPTLGTTMVPDSFTYTATVDGQTSAVATVNIFVFTQYNCACDMNDEPGEGFPTYTLDQMQRRLLVRLGMAAMPTPPPGTAETINTFLEDAQTELYRMYKCFRLKRWFTWQLQQGIRFYDWNADIENTQMLIPAPSAPSASASTASGALAADTYQYVYTYVNDNGESTPSPPVSATLSAAGTITLTFANAAGISAINVYRYAATGPYGETIPSFMATVNNALTYADNGSVTPIAQQPPSANGTSLCSKTLDPRQIDGVYISRGDNVWQPLFEGIPPTMYTSKIQAIPQRYEVRQCIEIWPAPSDNTWQMRITGDFALRRFNQPLDVTTIDPHAIYLKALVDAAMHYGKTNVASATENSLGLYIKKLIAGTDANTRLWPGTGVVINAIAPVMKGLP